MRVLFTITILVAVTVAAISACSDGSGNDSGSQCPPPASACPQQQPTFTVTCNCQYPHASGDGGSSLPPATTTTTVAPDTTTTTTTAVPSTSTMASTTTTSTTAIPSTTTTTMSPPEASTIILPFPTSTSTSAPSTSTLAPSTSTVPTSNRGSCSSPGSNLAIVLDASGSGPMNASDFNQTREFIRDLIATLPAPNNVSLATFYHAGNWVGKSYIDFGAARSTFDAKINSLIQVRGTRNTDSGISVAAWELRNVAGPGVRKMLIITDGVSENPTKTMAEGTRAKQAGIELYAIGIGQNMRWSEITGFTGNSNAFTVRTGRDMKQYGWGKAISDIICGAPLNIATG